MADGKVVIDVTVDDSDAKKKLNDVEDAAKDTADSIEDLGDSAGKGGKSLGILDVAAGNLVSGGIQSLISGLGNAVQSLINLADETREFREDMAKLETAFTTTGHTSEDATKAYEDFYAILGESDRSVEAVNHLAELTKNTEELSQWSTIAAGVTAKFGDSLPIEGLTEAANETAKVGAVTGPLADALNWAGISEDKFNKALAKCNSEQERATLITNTLNKEYSAAAAEYNALTANTQAARRATAEMEQAQARLGAAFEPLAIGITEAKTAFFDFAANLAEGVAVSIEKTREAATGLNAEQRALVENAFKAAEALQTMREASAMSADTINAQFDYTQKLADELFGLADANGRVEDAERGRVEFILSELSAALGEEYTLIGNQIQRYNGLRDAINETIAAERTRLLLAEYQDDYVEALRASAEQEAAINAERTAMYNTLSELEDARSKENEVRIKYDEAVAEGANYRTIQRLGEELTAYETNTRNKELLYDRQQKKLTELEEKHAESKDTITAVEDAKAAMLAGNNEKAMQILADYDAALRGSTENTKTENEKQVEAARTKVIDTSVQLSLLEAEYEKKQKEMTDAEKAEMQKRIDNAKKQAQDARAEYKTVGGNMVEGLSEGVDEKDGSPTWNLAGKLKRIVTSAIEAAKKAADTHSPSKETAYIGEMMSEGLAVGIDEKREDAIKAMEELGEDTLKVLKDAATAEIKELESKNKQLKKEYDKADKALQKQRTKNNADRIDAQREALKEEYELNKEALDNEVTLAKERERAISDQQKLYESFISALQKTEEEYVKNVEATNQKLVDDTAAAWDRYNSALNGRIEQIKSSLNLFEKAEKGEATNGVILKQALQSQVDILTEYNKALDVLASKDVSSLFIDEIKGMGIDALPQIQALNSMTDDALDDYVALWEEKNRLATEAAIDELATMREETVAEVEQLRVDADAKLLELRAGYEANILALMQELGIGMAEAGDAGLKALGEQVVDYVNIGSQLMDGIAEGMNDSRSAVIREAVNSVMAAIDAAKEAAGIHSPSTVMRDEVGKNLALGTAEGWRDEVNAVKNTMQADLSAITASVRATVAAENARFSSNAAPADTGFSEIARAVGLQSAGINSLASEFRRGTGSTRPIIIQLDKRELGRAVVDVGGTETVRVGAKLALGGAV